MPQRPRNLIGPVAGANRNFHTGGFRTIKDPLCGVFESGAGQGYLLGLSSEFVISPQGYASIVPRIMYEQRPGSFRQELAEVKVLMPQTSIPVDQKVAISSSIVYNLLSAEVLYKHDVAMLGGVRLALAAGPAVSLVTGGHNYQVEDLITPENARLSHPDAEPGGRRLVLYDGDIPARNQLRFSLKAGMQAEFGMYGNQWIVTPGLYYDYGLSDVTHSENWQLNSLMFMIDIRHAF
jgi:hypothetical protein